MKKTIILVFACVVAAAGIAQQFASNAKLISNVKSNATFAWMETVHDFGTIKSGVPVEHKFTFTNSGNEALVITSVQASCGCTVTEYTKEPIQMGHKGFVKATYNAAKVGVFSKTVTIKANTTEESVILTIKGEVVE